MFDGIKYKGQDWITKGISGYYQRLYNKVEPEDNEDTHEKEQTNYIKLK